MQKGAYFMPCGFLFFQFFVSDFLIFLIFHTNYYYMIKLEVNHGKHKKQPESGKKLTANAQKQPEKAKQQVNPKQKEDEKSKPNQPINQKQNIKNPKEDQIAPPKDKILQTIQRIKKEQLRTKVTIEELICQYRDSADDLFTNHGHNEEKQKIIAQKLGRLQKEKDERHRKMEKIGEKSLNKSLQQEAKLKDKLAMKQQRRRQRNKKRAEQKLLSLKALSQQRLQKQAKYQDYYNNEYKSKVPRFKKYQEEFERREKQLEEQTKQLLRKNADKYQPMNSDQLAQFQDMYDEKRWAHAQESEKRREQTFEFLANENRLFLGKLWRGQCHKQIKEERANMEQKKNEAKTKLEKTREYGTIIKEEFKPKISDERRNHSLAISKTINNLNVEQDEENRYHHVAREKFIKGNNQGLVIQKLRMSLDRAQKVRQGNAYLEQIRNLPKVRNDGVQSARLAEEEERKSQLEASLVRKRMKSPETTFKQKKRKNPYYSEKISHKGVESIKLKDRSVVDSMLADIKASHQQMNLQQKVIRHGRYNGILQLQNKQNNLNQKMIQSISDKLELLSRI